MDRIKRPKLLLVLSFKKDTNNIPVQDWYRVYSIYLISNSAKITYEQIGIYLKTSMKCLQDIQINIRSTGLTSSSK